MLRILLMIFLTLSVATVQATGSNLRAANDNTTKEMDQAILDQDLTQFFHQQDRLLESSIDFNKIRNLHINFLVFVKALIKVTDANFISMTANSVTVQISRNDIPRVARRVVDHFNRMFAYIAHKGFLEELILQQFSDRYLPVGDGGEWLLPSVNILTTQNLLDMYIEKKSNQFFGIYQQNVLWSAALSRLVNIDSWSVENQLAYNNQRRIVETAYRGFHSALKASPQLTVAFTEYADASLYTNSLIPLEDRQNFINATKPSCLQLLK